LIDDDEEEQWEFPIDFHAIILEVAPYPTDELSHYQGLKDQSYDNDRLSQTETEGTLREHPKLAQPRRLGSQSHLCVLQHASEWTPVVLLYTYLLVPTGFGAIALGGWLLFVLCDSLRRAAFSLTRAFACSSLLEESTVMTSTISKVQQTTAVRQDRQEVTESEENTNAYNLQGSHTLETRTLRRCSNEPIPVTTKSEKISSPLNTESGIQ